MTTRPNRKLLSIIVAFVSASLFSSSIVAGLGSSTSVNISPIQQAFATNILNETNTTATVSNVTANGVMVENQTLVPLTLVLGELNELCKTISTRNNLSGSDCNALSLIGLNQTVTTNGKIAFCGIFCDAVSAAVSTYKKIKETCARPGTCVDGKQGGKIPPGGVPKPGTPPPK